MPEVSYHHPDFFDRIDNAKGKHVHLILIATKPDIIKQIPLYRELQKRGHTVVLGHTGQHYDENLSGGMLKEFGVEPDFNLNVRGAMHEVVSQIIGRGGEVMSQLKERGKIVIPYVHGDTTTSMAASIAGYSLGFASVHVEAGMRTLTPNYERVAGSEKRVANGYSLTANRFDVAHWHTFLQDRSNWARGSQEPYPEQFNTRSSEAASGIHLAPVELDREFLLSEGFAEDRVFVVGNSVADAVAQGLANAKNSPVFEKFPVLQDGDFVRFCIHRRENCASKLRFTAIFEAMKQLIDAGKIVLLISLFQTESAIDTFGLRSEVERLAKNKNFVYSKVWAQYTDVIAAMSRAAVCATDSGSMQEEMNVMSVPCVTLRFGSDRSESVMAGGNIIAPPIDADVIRKTIEFAWDNKDMRTAPKLYGKNVSAACIDAVEKVLKKGEVFRTDEERLVIK